MEELLAVIARGLVEDKEAVSVTVDEPDEEGTVVYHLHVAASDMGRVIGRQGKIARAIRTLMRTAANRAGKKVAARTQEKGAMTPQETDPDMPMSGQKSPAEAWVSGGLLQGSGARSAAVCAWDLLKEVTIIFISFTIV